MPDCTRGLAYRHECHRIFLIVVTSGGIVGSTRLTLRTFVCAPWFLSVLPCRAPQSSSRSAELFFAAVTSICLGIVARICADSRQVLTRKFAWQVFYFPRIPDLEASSSPAGGSWLEFSGTSEC